MARYVVQTQVECLYTFHCAKSDGGETQVSPPSFFPSEWMIEVGKLSSHPWASKDDADQQVPAQTVLMHRPVVLEARAEADALTQAEKRWRSWHSDNPPHFSLNGWHLRETTFHSLSARKLDQNRKLKRNFEVDCAKLVAPDIGRNQLEVDQQFELLHWMWKIAENYEAPAPYRPWSVRRLLLGGSSDWANPVPFITSQSQLFQMLANGILGRGHDIYDMWRHDQGLAYGSITKIPAAHFGKGARSVTTLHAELPIDRAIWTAMKDLPGQSLIISPNHMHPKATAIRSFGISVHDKGFSFEITYGYDNDEFGSSWRHVLASTRGDETFYETAERALGLIHQIAPDYRSRFRREQI